MTELDFAHYPGGKNALGVWQWVVSLMPVHVFYGEPFVGSARVLREKLPALRSVVGDVTFEVVSWLNRQAIPGVEIYHGCGVEWLECQDTCGQLSDEWLVYCDPPYPRHVRSGRRLYGEEWSDDKHEHFLSVVAGLRCQVMVSSYASGQYESWLSSWNRFERHVMTRGGSRTEVIWMNCEPGQHVTTDVARGRVGANWRERQRIEKKVNRWRDKFESLPRVERREILRALVQVGFGVGRSGSGVEVLHRPPEGQREASPAAMSDQEIEGDSPSSNGSNNMGSSDAGPMLIDPSVVDGNGWKAAK